MFFPVSERLFQIVGMYGMSVRFLIINDRIGLSSFYKNAAARTGNPSSPSIASGNADRTKGFGALGS